MDNDIKLKISIDNKEAVASIKLTDENIKELYKSFKYGKQEVNGLETAISQGFNNAREIIQGVKETYSVLSSMFREPVQIAMSFEQANISFEVLLGNADKAKQMVRDLKEFGAKTPLEFAGLQENAKVLLNFGIEAEEILPTLKMLGDISGGDAGKMQSLTLAFAQMSSAGRLMGQDLLQMINAGFNPLQEISQRTGISMGELKTQMENGKISTDMIIEAFRSATSEGGKFYNMLAKQADTTAGAMSNFNDNITNIKANIGGAIAEIINPFISVLSRLFQAINEFSPQLVGVVGALVAFKIALVTLKVTGLTGILNEFNFVTAAVQRFKLQMALAPAGIGLVQTSIFGLKAAFQSLNASLGVFGWIAIGITAVTTAISLLNDQTDEMSESNKQAVIEADKERIKINELSKIILDEKKTMQERNKAKEDAQKIYPDYLKNISIEKSNIKDLRTEITEATKGFREFIDLKILNTRLDLAIEEMAKLQNEGAKPSFLEMVLYGKDAGAYAINKYAEKIIEAQSKINNIQEEISKKNKTTGTPLDATPNGTGLKQIFERQKEELMLAQNHAITMAEIEGKSQDEISKMKIEHFYTMIELYKKYGKDSTEITYHQLEEEARMLNSASFKARNPQYIDTGDLPASKGLTSIQDDRQTGDITEYQRLTALQEIELWQQKEYAKVAVYKNADELRKAIDREALQRKKELAESEQEIEEQKEQAKVDAAIGALNYIGASAGKHTALGKAAAAAQAGMNTYEAATKALTAGPFVGPILAGIITAMGLVNVSHILSTQTPKFTGYAEGGRLTAGQYGYVEGWRNEIIAPEKTFEDIMRYELIPKVVNNNVVSTQDFSSLERKFDDMITAFESKDWVIKGEDLYLTNKKITNRKQTITY